MSALSVTVPAPTTSREVYAAAQVVLATAYGCQWGARTIVGTPGHAAACILEQARLLAWIGTTEMASDGPIYHVWEITNLGKHDWEQYEREAKGT